jgi:hypothetical protein
MREIQLRVGGKATTMWGCCYEQVYDRRSDRYNLRLKKEYGETNVKAKASTLQGKSCDEAFNYLLKKVAGHQKCPAEISSQLTKWLS